MKATRTETEWRDELIGYNAMIGIAFLTSVCMFAAAYYRVSRVWGGIIFFVLTLAFLYRRKNIKRQLKAWDYEHLLELDTQLSLENKSLDQQNRENEIYK